MFSFFLLPLEYKCCKPSIKMGKSCCVKGCKNRFAKGSGISFHRFPTEPEQKTLWIQTIQSLNRFDWQPTMYTWVCGDHFQTGRPSHMARDADYIPNINLFPKPKEKKIPKKKEKKKNSLSKQKNKSKENSTELHNSQVVHEETPNNTQAQTVPDFPPLAPVQEQAHSIPMEIALSSDEGDSSESEDDSDDPSYFDIIEEGPQEPTVQELLMQLRVSEEERMVLVAKLSLLSDIRQEEKNETQAQLEAAHSEILLLQEEKTVLLELRQKDLELSGPPRNDVMSDNFLDDPERCSYYTGLPCSDKVSWVFSLVLPGVDSRSNIAPIKQLVLILIKIKLDPPLTDLAFRFNITINIANSIFDSWLPEMGKKLGALIKWPSENELINSLPQCFEIPRYRNSIIIIDLLELLTQQWCGRSDVLLKILVGFAPDGTVIYLSRCYECDVSDFSHFKIEQEFLNYLKPGDVVLADRMFDHGDFANIGAELICPPYYEGMHRIIEAGIIQEQNMLEVTSHVKKVVNRLKIFRMLATGIMPHTNAEHANYIVRACAGLINLNSPITQ